jgi:hypothetical protein
VTLDTFVLQSMSELNFKLMNSDIKSLPCCVIGKICRWGGVTDIIWWISYFFQLMALSESDPLMGVSQAQGMGLFIGTAAGCTWHHCGIPWL